MYEEVFASTFVAEKLQEWGIAHERGIAKTGVVATIEGRKNRSGRVVAFRADMDALDIVEQSGQEWSSRINGKMHGCGHDGHTASLLVLARYLNQTKNFDGVIRLIFQPAEEGGRGAAKMLEDGYSNASRSMRFTATTIGLSYPAACSEYAPGRSLQRQMYSKLVCRERVVTRRFPP